MNRHQLLRGLHERVRPRGYLEIGVADGASLTLSRVPSIAVDPAFKVVKELSADVELVRTTSDEFFSRERPLRRLPGEVADLAFIDGMHLSEYALRDFMNVERHTSPSSVVVLDDMLPRSVDEAARSRHTRAWTGDVYKVGEVLRQRRPELVVLEVDTQPTGTLVVLLPDRSSTVLHRAYDDVVSSLVTRDPQSVPDSVMNRSRAVDPASLLASRVWDQWATLRDRVRPTSRTDVLASLNAWGLPGLPA